jgi:hypothetical protein
MQLTPTCVSEILHGATLSSEDAAVIARLAYITAELDFEADVDESEALRSIVETLSAYAPESAEPVPLGALPIDDEERHEHIRTLAGELHAPEARELAYATAYLVIASNADLDRLQMRWLEQLQRALGLDDARAAELVAISARCVTPGLDEHQPTPTSLR